jgi:hypothetical protein
MVPDRLQHLPNYPNSHLKEAEIKHFSDASSSLQLIPHVQDQRRSANSSKLELRSKIHSTYLKSPVFQAFSKKGDVGANTACYLEKVRS